MFEGRSWTKLLMMLAASGLLFAAGCGTDTGNGGDDDDDGEEMQDTFSGEDTGIDDAGDDEDDEDASMDDAGDDEGDADDPGDTGSGDGGDAGEEEFNCTFFPDDCGDEQQCRYNPQAGERECIPTGEAMAGESCGQQTLCAQGMTCTGTSQDDLSCRTKCDTDNTEEFGCPEGSTCVMIEYESGGTAPYGACQEVEQNCDHYPNDSCGEGQNCYPTQGGGAQCIDFNSDASEGDTCDPSAGIDGRCNEDQFCVGTAGGGDSTCRDKCDTEASSSENACDSGETCNPLQGDVPFGVCASGGGGG